MVLLNVLLHITDIAVQLSRDKTVQLSRDIEFWFLMGERFVRWSTLKLFGSANPCLFVPDRRSLARRRSWSARRSSFF